MLLRVFLLYSTGILPWSALAASALAGYLPANPKPENIWQLTFMPCFYEYKSGNTMLFNLPQDGGKIIALNAPARPTFLKYIIESVLLLADIGSDKITILQTDAPCGFTIWIACLMYSTKRFRATGKKLIARNIIKALPKIIPACLQNSPQLD